MSGWAIITRTLGDLGGGPAKAAQFTADCVGDPKGSIERARTLGLIRHAGSRYLWELTELGRDFCAGRVRVVDGGRKGPHRFVRAAFPIFGDGWIERLLLEAGHEPGTAVTPGVMRAYTAAVAKLARGDYAAG